MKRTKKEEDKTMSFANKHNTGNAASFTYKQIENPAYVKVKDLYQAGHVDKETAIKVRGCFISNKGRFGKSGVLVCDGFNVNLPKHMTEDIESILQDPDDIASINNECVGFFTYPYKDSQGGTSYGVTWVDLPGIAPVAIDNKDLPY